MLKIKVKYPYLLAFNAIILLELLSFLAYFIPYLQIYFLSAFFIILLIIAWHNLEIGILVALTELVIGSKGHLLSAHLFNFNFSLRMAIWLALLLLAVFIIFKKIGFKSYIQRLKSYPFYKILIIFLIFIVIGLVNAYFSGNNLNLVFDDVNAWLYLAWLIPLSIVYLPFISQRQSINLLKVFYLALAWLSLKTLVLLFFFSHNSIIVPDLYLWIRRSGVGEITDMGGSWYRIFIQSQIYIVIGFLMALFLALKKNFINIIKEWQLLAIMSILFSIIVVSMSRSFWLALLASILIGLIIFARLKWGVYLKAFVYLLLSFILAIALIFAIIKFPYPAQKEVISMDALSKRLEIREDEAALASRWALLPELWQEISKRPMLGSGFGATVSYVSSDPRVLERDSSGLYTSYAFEWAYLDIWLKIGLLGLVAFLSYLFFILIKLYNLYKLEKNPFYFTLALSLLFLMIVNIFTPYLNHPLGLAFVLISSCFIKKNDL